MNKLKLLFVAILILTGNSLFAQEQTFKVYDPTADASLQIKTAVAEAEKSNKHILLEIGGNWCKWCRLFYNFCNTTPVVDSLLNADYVVLHINYSKENKNLDLLKKLDYPQRFGFPVFVVLDVKGNRIHTQNSAYLEKDEGYGEEKVVDFLKGWNRNSLKAENYK